MSNEEIKTLIEQEELKIPEAPFHLNAPESWAWQSGYKKGLESGFFFYEQSILPEVLKEKDEQIKTAELGRKEYFRLHNTALERVQELTSQLSQLQSKMEEEKRKAFEAD
jgi:hypothetical protein